MASFDAIVSDLTGMTEFVNALAGANQDSSRMLAAQVDAFQHRIGNLPRLTHQEAASLTRIISEGPWSSEQKQSLIASVVTGVGGCGQTQTVKLKRAMQRCDHFQNYMTQSEWDSLLSGAVRTAKISQICSRAWTIGLTCPVESTTYRMACIIAHCCNVEDAGELMEIHLQVKKTLKYLDSQRQYPHAHLTLYPESVEDLPKNMRDYAYDEAPVSPSLPELDVVASIGNVRMRGKQNKLQQELDALCKKLKVDKSTVSVKPAHVAASKPPAITTHAPPAPLALQNASSSTGVQDASSRSPSCTKLVFKPLLALPPVDKTKIIYTEPKAAGHNGTNAIVNSDGQTNGGTSPAENDVTALEKDLLNIGKSPANMESGHQKMPAAAKPTNMVKDLKKRPAAAKRITANNPPTNIPASLVLGCSKCRYSPGGCLQCRNPAYGGKRGPKFRQQGPRTKKSV